MKLYYGPGACSLSPHIVLRELGLPFSLERVDIKTGRFAGGDFKDVNPKGYVPALELEDGSLLTEGIAIVCYLADQKPEAGLLPAAGSMERYRCLEWLTYISTELHKNFAPLFQPWPAEVQAATRELLRRRFAFVHESLGDGPFLMGDRFTVADAYLFTVLGWARFKKIDLQPFPSLLAYVARVGARPAVEEATKAEGISR
jgi:glutathione S-transferase